MGFSLVKNSRAAAVAVKHPIPGPGRNWLGFQYNAVRQNLDWSWEMSILGAHMSISGGYFRAVELAAEAGCDCVQIFTKNNNQWRAKPITDDDARKFRDALKEHKIVHPLSHASYLINLASPDRELRTKSVDAMVVELQRASHLGIPFVVVHPGSHTTSSEEQGLATMIKSLDKVIDRTLELKTITLLENTAGQGSNLGWKFEHLGIMLKGVREPGRLGVCIDTCHAFAAGYPLGDKNDYEQTVKHMGKAFGIRKIKAFHLNDSKQPLNSRRDRHENIGLGEMGLTPFRNLLNDKRFVKIPMYLETPKGQTKDGEDWDRVNLRTLRKLIAHKSLA
jgi:deoxyribonuclease-4